MPLTDTVAALQSAQQNYTLAASAADSARAEESRALGVLNKAQKAVDDAMKELKAGQPTTSDWRVN